jgi:hypothetical protein
LLAPPVNASQRPIISFPSVGSVYGTPASSKISLAYSPRPPKGATWYSSSHSPSEGLVAGCVVPLSLSTSAKSCSITRSCRSTVIFGQESGLVMGYLCLCIHCCLAEFRTSSIGISGLIKPYRRARLVLKSPPIPLPSLSSHPTPSPLGLSPSAPLPRARPHAHPTDIYPTDTSTDIYPTAIALLLSSAHQAAKPHSLTGKEARPGPRDTQRRIATPVPTGAICPSPRPPRLQRGTFFAGQQCYPSEPHSQESP